MATPKKSSLTTIPPDWLAKIHKENVDAANQAFLSLCDFVMAKLEFESRIDDINAKYGSKFKLTDIFRITQEQEQQALDMFEGEDDDED